MVDENNQQEPKKKESCGKTFLAIIGVLAIIIVVVLIIMRVCDSSSNEDNKDGGLTTRAARTSDISFEDGSDISITLSLIYYFTPSVDIDDLEIPLTFMDSNRDTLTTKVENVGDVKEGGRYSISYSVSDLGLSVILKYKTISWRVTGGTVSYFA